MVVSWRYPYGTPAVFNAISGFRENQAIRDGTSLPLIRRKRIRRDLVNAAKLHHAANDVNRSLVAVRITNRDGGAGIRTEPFATNRVTLRCNRPYLKHVACPPTE